MRPPIVVLWAIAMLAGCAPLETRNPEPVLYVFSTMESAFIELDSNLQPLREIPLAMPEGCAFGNAFPAPRGSLLAIELNCSFGQAVVLLNVETGKAEQPIRSGDSHFLAWEPRGNGLYLRIDTLNRPRILNHHLNGREVNLPIPELTYELSPAPAADEFVFALSRGMNLGSEMWIAREDGAAVQRMTTDENHYLGLLRWSPDGSHIAFIRIPDSPTPFKVGELWVMNSDGSNARKLAEADAGHGYAPVWSPNGRQIAFIQRVNAEDPRADTSVSALQSNLYLAGLEDGRLERLTDLHPLARAEGPAWRPDGQALAVTIVTNDRMHVWLIDPWSNELQQVPIEWACCAGWLRK